MVHSYTYENGTVDIVTGGTDFARLLSGHMLGPN